MYFLTLHLCLCFCLLSFHSVSVPLFFFYFVSCRHSESFLYLDPLSSHTYIRSFLSPWSTSPPLPPPLLHSLFTFLYSTLRPSPPLGFHLFTLPSCYSHLAFPLTYLPFPSLPFFLLILRETFRTKRVREEGMERERAERRKEKRGDMETKRRKEGWREGKKE